jgi:hypothetical protein
VGYFMTWSAFRLNSVDGRISSELYKLQEEADIV